MQGSTSKRGSRSNYGSNLAECPENEFGYYFFRKSGYTITEPVKSIDFGSYLVAINNGAVDDGRIALEADS